MLNVIVFGVGYSGTSIVVKMLKELGWNVGDVGTDITENKEVLDVNKYILAEHGICPCGNGTANTEKRSVTGFSIECPKCRQTFTTGYIGSSQLSYVQETILSTLPTPWCIKDPRMVRTLPLWKKHLQVHNPVLVLVERDTERVKKAYEKHKFNDHGIYGFHIDSLKTLARKHWDGWNENKIRINYEDLQKAIGLW